VTHREDSVAEIKARLIRTHGDELFALLGALEQDARSGVRAAVAAARRRALARETESRRLSELYALESQLGEDGFVCVAGVDEVGRGALAGPLTAGACVLPTDPRIDGLNDSKRLSALRRAALAETIKHVAICWAVGHATPNEVDSLGVTVALRRAMSRALAGLAIEPDHVIVDGLPMGVATTETAVVKGDSKVAAVAAASILAKVTRDAMMVELAMDHPQYGFDVNKGYGTPDHMWAITRVGLSPIHRRSFCSGGSTESLF